MRFTPYSEPSDAEIDALRHQPTCDCGAPVEHFGDTCDACNEILALALEETTTALSLPLGNKS